MATADAVKELAMNVVSDANNKRPMKALTVLHPWAWAIACQGKRIENRTWKPSLKQLMPGEWFAIHGAKRPVGRATDVVWGQAAVLMDQHGIPGPPPAEAIMPGIVAVAMFAGTTTESRDPWFHGPYGWRLGHVVTLPEAVPCKGAQGLWVVPEGVRAKVIEQYHQATGLAQVARTP